MKKCAATNNPQEGWFGVIKRDYNMRSRLDVGRFLNQLVEYVTIWSTDYESGLNEFKTQKSITIKTWITSYEWKCLNRKVLCYKTHEPGLVRYMFGGSKFEGDLRAFDSSFTTFDEYTEKRFYVYNVYIKNENFMDGTCECRSFQKADICKHIVGLAIRNRWVVVPDAAKNVPVKEKAKRGRRAKAEKALVRQ